EPDGLGPELGDVYARQQATLRLERGHELGHSNRHTGDETDGRDPGRTGSEADRDARRQLTFQIGAAPKASEERGPPLSSIFIGTACRRLFLAVDPARNGLPVRV